MPDQIEMLGRYQLIRPLGEGGMGRVYAGRDTELNREVAIKCFKVRKSSTDMLSQLRREATLLAQLNHPNVVQMYDVVEENGRMGMVMEYVQGQTLLTKRKEALPEQQQALQWLIQIAEGLAAAHQAGIIHCDLKPDNILIGRDGTAKISDFGIARAQQDGSEQLVDIATLDTVSGSYLSVSPEQASGEKIDFRTDIFSFGLLAYQLLTGRHAFGNTRNQLEMTKRIVNDRFQFNAADDRLLSIPLMEMISSLLQKRPEDRPVNIGIVAAQLRQIASYPVNKNQPADDATVIFEAIKPEKPVWRHPLLNWALVSLLVFTAGWLTWLNWPQKQLTPLYVAVLNPVITAVDGFDPDQQRQISATIKTSLQEGLLNISRLSLIPNTNLDDFSGSIADMARAVAADNVLQVEVDCNLAQCQIHMQKLEGRNWSVVKQRIWPVVANSLSDIRSTLLQELPQIFSISGQTQPNTVVSEEVYRRYLEIYHASAAGVGADDDHLMELEGLQSKAPEFYPLYNLYSDGALHRFSVSGDDSYLLKHQRLMDQAPPAVANLTEFRHLEFRQLIEKGETENAELIVEQLAGQGADRVIINDMLASLAYKDNDLVKAVELDRKNIILRPSAQRYYNLAVDEYMLGNLDAAALAVGKGLKIDPQDTYAQNLNAAIAMGRGDIDQAVQAYRTLIKSNPDSSNLSNLGVALMLNGDYLESIDFHKKAVQKKPENPGILINLADSYGLSGNTEMAAKYYRQVLRATQGASDDGDHHVRAQAQAQLGDFNQAIKTLLLAKRTPELAYAAAIVHSLAGNNNAAVVEVENAISGGTGSIWFHIEWFRPLCAYPLFKSLIDTENRPFCVAG